MASSIAITSCGELPQVTCGFSAEQSMSITRSYSASRFVDTARASRRPPGPTARPSGPSAGRCRYSNVVSSAAMRPPRAPNSIDMLQMVSRPSIGMRADGRAGILHDMADAGIDTVAADQRQDHVLGVDAASRRAVELGAQRARLAHDQRLGGEHLHHLGGADAPGPGADAAAARGVAVTTDVGAARQREAQMRPDHMHDAVVGVDRC